MDISKAVLKKIIVEDISSNYNVGDDDINGEVDEWIGALKKSGPVIVGNSDSNQWSLLHRKEKYIFLMFYVLEKVLHRLTRKFTLLAAKWFLVKIKRQKFTKIPIRLTIYDTSPELTILIIKAPGNYF